MSRPQCSPVFGLEIEIFVKIKRSIQVEVQRHRQQLPPYWQNWDFGLSNRTEDPVKLAHQRTCVKMAILSLIDQALGEGSGWTVVSDASLKESELRAPVENNLWCPSLCLVSFNISLKC